MAKRTSGHKTHVLKPDKRPFVLYRWLIFFIISSILVSLALLFSYFNDALLLGSILIPVLIISNIVFYAYRIVRYNKEEYELQHSRLILRKGGFFTEHETELIVRNITQVWLNLPFIENKIFCTGNLKIKAAGSSGAEIHMASISDPKKKYDMIEKLMVNNGFVLTRKKKIMEERPSVVAVLFERMSYLGSIIVFSFILPFGAVIGFVQSLAFAIVIALVVLIAILVMIVLVIDIINNLRRVYYLYDDMLEYYDGFMARNYSLIPIENLSDTETTQNIIERLIDVYDVKISSQGSGNEIYFKNMPNGKKMKKELDKLISITESLIDSSEERGSDDSKDKGRVESSASFSSSPRPHDSKADLKKADSFTTELTMDPVRAIVPTVIITIFFFFLVTIISAFVDIGIPAFFVAVPLSIFGLILLLLAEIIPLGIMIGFTKFKVGKYSIERDFRFLTSKNVEYSIDKITLMRVSESIIDKIFRTFTITFSTIGGGQNIVFRHIKKDVDLEIALRRKLGFSGSKKVSSIDSQFSFLDMCMKNLYFFALGDLIALLSIFAGIFFNPLYYIYLPVYLLIVIGAYIYQIYYYRTSKLYIYKDFFMFTRGLIIDTRDYALFSDMKDLSTISYPYSGVGSARFNIAGEVLSQGQNGSQAVISNGFKVNYIQDVSALHEKIDHILLNNPMKGKRSHISSAKMEDVVKSCKPSVKNSISAALVISILAFPIILLLPVTIFITRLYVRRVTYVINPYRVSKEVGVLFRKRTTVLFNRFDHLSVRQGFFNKIFKNGKILVFTAGSSNPELDLWDLPDHRKFYDMLERKYKG